MDDDSLFSKDGTVARSSQDIVRFFYLQRFEDLLKAQKKFYSTLENSGSFPIVKREWKAVIISLFSLCTPRIKKKSQKKDYEYNFDKIKELIDDDKFKEVSDLLIEYLEVDLKITDIAKVQDYDRTNIIKSNKMKGYK